MRNAAIIVAAGRGHRAGGAIPKQYVQMGTKTILARSIEAMLDHPQIDAVLVVIHEDDRQLYEAALTDITDDRIRPPVVGGETRAISVRNGLEALEKANPQHVFIHDAARPFLTKDTIDHLITALAQHDGAFPAIPVADALWHADTMAPQDRSGLIRAQTPQSFKFSKILTAHRNGQPDARDDVEIAVKAGLRVEPVTGDEGNFKVTTQDDLNRAQQRLIDPPDIRVGHGYDVHAFTEGNAVILNGVEIPHSRSLKGHSDADVAMHAITDAIYGALAEGDIGQWFPPSDPQWKGAASDIFLKHAVERAQARGFQITHIDCTLICEEPKIGPHAQAMRQALSGITGLEQGRISVKATTSEQLGFTGRREGIAAQATATLVSP